LMARAAEMLRGQSELHYAAGVCGLAVGFLTGAAIDRADIVPFVVAAAVAAVTYRRIS
jgi:hypothetical protein